MTSKEALANIARASLVNSHVHFSAMRQMLYDRSVETFILRAEDQW